jgi:hypothetical protein
MHAWGYVKNRKKAVTCRIGIYCELFFFFFARKIHAHRRSRATMASPWATRIAACLSRGPLSLTPEKSIQSSGPRNKKCSSSASKCLSVWAKNILGSFLLMAHDGHMGQTAYRCVRHRVYRDEHPNTP